MSIIFIIYLPNNIAYYKGENILSDEIQKTYLSLMKELKSICDKKGIQLQFMIIPGIIAVLSESDNSTRLFIFSESDIL